MGGGFRPFHQERVNKLLCLQAYVVLLFFMVEEMKENFHEQTDVENSILSSLSFTRCDPLVQYSGRAVPCPNIEPMGPSLTLSVKDL